MDSDCGPATPAEHILRTSLENSSPNRIRRSSLARWHITCIWPFVCWNGRMTDRRAWMETKSRVGWMTVLVAASALVVAVFLLYLIATLVGILD